LNVFKILVNSYKKKSHKFFAGCTKIIQCNIFVHVRTSLRFS